MLTVEKSQLKVLYGEEEIAQRISELAVQINADYKDCKDLIIVGVLKGAFVFTSDLVRKLDLPIQVEFIRLSSYEGTESTGNFKVYDLTLPSLKDKDILIVDDIVDSGRTAKFLLDFFKNQGGVKTVKLVTLFDKSCKRLDEFSDINPDYCCFNVDDKFILGYGLDYEQKFREMPYIGYIEAL